MRERLIVKLELTIAGASHTIPGGDVRSVELALTSWGMTGTLEFIVKDDVANGGARTDALLVDFLKPDLIEVKVSLTSSYSDLIVTTALPTLITRGVVTERSVREDTWLNETSSPALMVRTYRVSLVDQARALWGQHKPWTLYTKTTLKSVFEAERGPVSLTFDWDKLTVVRPLVFVGLSADRAPDFLDFVCWRVAREGGVFTFDHALGGYALLGKRVEGGEAQRVLAEEVVSVENVFAASPRASHRVVNVDSALAKRSPVASPRAVTGVFRDTVVRSPTSQQVDDEVALAGNKPAAPQRELRVIFGRYPTAAIAPGSLLDLSKKGGFSSVLLAGSGPWRVFALDLKAHTLARGPDDGDQVPDGAFEVELSVRLEAKDDTAQRLPPFVAPEYPGSVEGIVICEGGADDEHPYEFKQDEATSLDVYRVKLPLFENQEVNPPYDPQHGADVIYHPMEKEARVLVALHFDCCLIERRLAWRDGARVPMDAQGRHLLLGKSDTSNTSVLLDYQSEKPVFRILRTNDKDTAVMLLEEGRMMLQVRETSE